MNWLSARSYSLTAKVLSTAELFKAPSFSTGASAEFISISGVTSLTFHNHILQTPRWGNLKKSKQRVHGPNIIPVYWIQLPWSHNPIIKTITQCCFPKAFPTTCPYENLIATRREIVVIFYCSMLASASLECSLSSSKLHTLIWRSHKHWLRTLSPEGEHHLCFSFFSVFALLRKCLELVILFCCWYLF